MKLFGKFRMKIAVFSVISIFIISTAILGSMNAYNFIMITVNADKTLDEIAELGGKINEKDNPPEEGAGPKDSRKDAKTEEPPDTIEKAFAADYFTYSFDEENNATKIAFDIPDISEKSAQEMALSVLNNGTGWKELYYRYKNYEYNDLKYVTIINEKRELEPSYRILNTSIIGILIGVAFAFLAIIPISKWILVPVEYSVKKQKRFISDASHELKTPLAIISLNNDLEVLEKGESENTSNITEQVKLMNEMVKNLNELAKIDENEKVIFSSVNISKIASDESAMFEKIYESKNILYAKSIEKNLTIEGNEEMLKKLFSLILDNASKYSSSKIILTIHKENKKIVIQETNDCQGIPEGNLNMVFERFYRLQEDRSSNTNGSGIGLSVVKEIVDKHHGEVKAEGKEGNFILTITL